MKRSKSFWVMVLFAGLVSGGIAIWMSLQRGAEIILGISMVLEMAIGGALIGISLAELIPFRSVRSISPDFRHDLRAYEEGEITLEQFVDHWSGRMPSKMKAVVETSHPEKNAITSLTMYKSGQWVRIKATGELAQIYREAGYWVTRYYFIDRKNNIGGQMVSRASDIELAIPRNGEWWEKKDCNHKHQTFPGESYWSKVPTRWKIDGDCNPDVVEAAACGCLVPVNFGEGEPLKCFHPGQWVRIKAGYYMGGQLASVVSHSNPEPQDEERYILMTSEGPMDIGAYALKSALPKPGEWWIKEHCELTWNHGGMWLYEPHVWCPDCKISGPTEDAALCGCYHPINFGRGFKKT